MAAGDVNVDIVSPNAKAGASFDGVDDNILIPDEASFDVVTAITLSAWVYPKSFTGGFETILARGKTQTSDGDDDSSPYVLTTRLGVPRFELRNAAHNAGTVNATGALSLNTWTHVLGTWDGSIGADNMKIYINGVLDDSSSQTTVAQIKTFVNVSKDVIIGYDKVRSSASFDWDGYIAGVKIWKRGFSSVDAANDFASNNINDELVHEYLLEKDYKDTKGSADGTNDGTRLGIFEDDIAAAIKAARVSANDTFVITECANGLQVVIPTIEEAP